MRTLRRLFDFYLDASIHVGLAVTSLVLTTCILLNILTNYSLLGFVLFATIVCYNFIKYGVEAEKYLIVSKKYHKKIQIFSFFSFLLALFFLSQLKKEVWFAVIGLSILSMLYAIPFLPNTKNLRNLAGFKIYIVGLVWSGFTVLLPVLDAQIELNWDVFVVLVQRFLLIIILMLPFEVRDMERDKRELWTIPQVLGIKHTKILGICLTLIFVAASYLKDDIFLIEIMSRVFIGIILVILLLRMKKKQSIYFSSFWIEAIPMAWVVVLVLLEKLY